MIDSSLEDILRSAADAERATALDTALELYQCALDSLFNDMKSEINEEKKASIEGIFITYLEVAENLKARIERSKSTPKSALAPLATSESKPDFFDYTAAAREKRMLSAPVVSKTAVAIRTKATVKSEPKKTEIAGSAGVGGSGDNSSKQQQGRGGGGSGANAKAETALSEYEQQIMEEMLDSSPGVTWGDIAGLALAKQTLQEAVILPNLRPDLFTGLRSPPKGVLLFGPPGTGKTLLAKAVATESGFTFFSISASSVTSKYLGEGEKLMKALFTAARRMQPAVIFFDEIDAIMSVRKENEHEASRRVKTEFMTQADGASTSVTERLLILAATNIPWDLDEAVLRRLVKRIYVPLPDDEARRGLILHLVEKQQQQHQHENNAREKCSRNDENKIEPRGIKLTSSTSEDSHGAAGFLSEASLDEIVRLTKGYSGSDIKALCHEAAMGPIRELGMHALKTVRLDEVRPIVEKDFTAAVAIIRPSVSADGLQAYSKWAEQFGVK